MSRAAKRSISPTGLLLWLLVTLCPGCAPFHGWKHAGKNQRVMLTGRDTNAAHRLHQQALRFIRKCDDAEAEQRLNQAILADSQFGPAHNNLGQIYFRRGRYYLAAWEFEAAARLMPNRPEPPNNLGLVYEAARRFPDAIQSFQLAHDLAPTNPIYLGNLIRAMLRDEESDQEAIGHFLNELLLIETRPDWRVWALQQHAAMHSQRTGQEDEKSG